MEKDYIEDETFKEVNFLETPLTADEYENSSLAQICSKGKVALAYLCLH